MDITDEVTHDFRISSVHLTPDDGAKSAMPKCRDSSLELSHVLNDRLNGVPRVHNLRHSERQ